MLSFCSHYTSNYHLLSSCYHSVLIILLIVIIYYRYVVILFWFYLQLSSFTIVMLSLYSDYTSNCHHLHIFMLSLCSDYTSNCHHLLSLCYHSVLIRLLIVTIYYRYVIILFGLEFSESSFTIIMFSFCSDYILNCHHLLSLCYHSVLIILLIVIIYISLCYHVVLIILLIVIIYYRYVIILCWFAF